MTDSYTHVNGLPCRDVTLYLPWIGPWIAELRQVDETPIAGAVTLTAGDLIMQGTVKPDASGSHLQRVAARIVGGAGGWGTLLSPKGYHNDAGIKAALVADDAATAAGESLDLIDFAPLSERIGSDYVRTIGPAARALEDAIGGVPWWVAHDGITHAKPRPTAEASPDVYDILEYDPHRRLAQIAVDDLSAIGVGSILTKSPPLDRSLTVRDLTIRISSEGLALEAWCGGADDEHSRAAQLVAEIARRSTDSTIHGMWRYRVTRTIGDRVELQAVRQAVGIPDLLLVSMWPGAAGVHATLEPAAEVLVQFIEGDRTQPVITHFAGKDGVGHIPIQLALCGDTFKAARQGDLVQSGGLGATIMLVGAPGPVQTGLAYLVSFAMPPAVAVPQTPLTPGPLFGSVITGSSKVKIGSDD